MLSRLTLPQTAKPRPVLHWCLFAFIQPLACFSFHPLIEAFAGFQGRLFSPPEKSARASEPQLTFLFSCFAVSLFSGGGGGVYQRTRSSWHLAFLTTQECGPKPRQKCTLLGRGFFSHFELKSKCQEQSLDGCCLDPPGLVWWLVLAVGPPSRYFGAPWRRGLTSFVNSVDHSRSFARLSSLFSSKERCCSMDASILTIKFLKLKEESHCAGFQK